MTRLFAPFRMSSIRAGMCPSLVACSSLGLVTEMGRLSYTSPSTLLLTPFLDVSADLKENVAQQVKNLLASQVVQDDWKRRGQFGVTVHGWVYQLESGVVRDMGISQGPPTARPGGKRMGVRFF